MPQSSRSIRKWLQNTAVEPPPKKDDHKSASLALLHDLDGPFRHIAAQTGAPPITAPKKRRFLDPSSSSSTLPPAVFPPTSPEPPPQQKKEPSPTKKDRAPLAERPEPNKKESVPRRRKKSKIDNDHGGEQKRGARVSNSKKRETKQVRASREKSAAAILHDFRAANVTADRLTLKPSETVGKLFSHHLNVETTPNPLNDPTTMHAKPGRSYDTRDPSASLPPGREAGRIPAVSTVTSHSRLVPPRNSPPPSPHPQPSKVSPSHSRSIPQFCIELEALLDGWEGILPLGLASEIKRLVNERLLPNKIRTTTEHLEKMKHPPDEHRKRSSSPVSWDPTEVANEKDRVSVSHEQSDSACRKTDTHHDQEPAVNSDPKKPAERDPLCRDHDETASCPPLAEVEDNRGSMRPSRSRNSGRFSDHPSIDTISKRFSGPLTEDNISWHLDTPEDDEDDFAVPGFAWRPNILY